MRYRLRTLMIVLAMGPPTVAVAWWVSKTDDELVHTAAAIVVLVFAIWLGVRVLAYLP